MENKNTGLKVLVVVLSILVIGMGGFITYDKVLKDKYFSKDKTKETDKTKENKEEKNSKDNEVKDDDKNTEKGLKAQDVENYVVSYMLDNKLAFLDKIYEWKHDQVVYVGYFKDKPNEKLYRVSGEFKCNDQNDITCVYQSVLEDQKENGYYPFGAYVIVTENNGNYIFGEVGGAYSIYSPDFVQINEELQ